MKGIIAIIFLIFSIVGLVYCQQAPTVVWPPTTSYLGTRTNWTNLAVTNYLTPREFQTMIYDQSNNRLIIFGGRAANGTYLNDVWSWSFPGKRFLQINPTGTPPPARAFHLAGIDVAKRRMLVFGGKNDQGELGDLWSFNLIAGREGWTQITASGGPSPRWGAFGGSWAGSGGSTYGSNFFVAYGKSGFANVYSDTWAFDMISDSWNAITSIDGNQPLFVIGTGQQSPSPRFATEFAMLGPNSLAIYGGCGAGGYGWCPGIDGWTMTVSGTQATYIPFVSSCPPRSYYGQGVPVPGTFQSTINRTAQILFFGGYGGPIGGGWHGESIFEDYDTTSSPDAAGSSWARTRILQTENNLLLTPGGRIGASMVLVHPPVAASSQDFDFIVFFGGRDSKETIRSDLWYLTGQAIVGRRFLCIVSIDYILIHGILMYASFGIIFPITVMLARFGKDSFLPGIRQKSPWLWAHASANIFGLIIAIPALVLILIEVNTAQFTSIPHAYLGIIAFGFICFNVIWAIFKPEKNSEKRAGWAIVHWWIGRLAVLLGLTNIMLGILMARANVVIFALYIVHLFILVFVFFLFQCLQYRREGVSCAEALNPSYKSSQYDY